MVNGTKNQMRQLNNYDFEAEREGLALHHALHTRVPHNTGRHVRICGTGFD